VKDFIADPQRFVKNTDLTTARGAPRQQKEILDATKDKDAKKQACEAERADCEY
jgi:hypothetical protein